MLTRAIAAFLIILCPQAAAQSTWFVEASGGGDFTAIQPAIDAASGGDIIRIGPGTYSGAATNKALSFLANRQLSRPIIDRLDVQNAPRVTLYDLEIGNLRLGQVPGAALVDYCAIGTSHSTPGVSWPTPALPSRFLIQDCGDVRLSRCRVTGDFDALTQLGYDSIRISGASQVQITACEVLGADTPAWSYSGWGGNAVTARDTSKVWVASSTLTGGNGEDLWSLGYITQYGLGGHAIRTQDTSTFDVRGNTNDWLIGGHGDAGGGWGSPPPSIYDGYAFRVLPGGILGSTISGTQLTGMVSSEVAFLAEPLPYLSFGAYSFAEEQLGDPRVLKGFAKAGSPLFVVASSQTNNLQAPILDTTPLWIRLDLAFLVIASTGIGIDFPVNTSFTLPTTPGLAGVEVHFQAYEILPAQLARGTNSVSVALSH